MNISRTNIQDIVERIEPFDDVEKDVIAQTVAWISGGSELYRRQKPDVPNKHLVSYFVLVDHPRRSLLLMDHLKSGLWLPPGGHVEPHEDPRATVVRELAEELGPRAAMVSSVAMMPLFTAASMTRGVGAHVDVTLWYVVAGDEHMWIDPDPREFRGHRWQSMQSILETDIRELDPEMHRFVRKLEARLDAAS